MSGPVADSRVGPERDRSARMAGVLLILTAGATVAAVAGRVAADADQPTLSESMMAIALDRWLYLAGGVARLVSGITLIAAAWLLLRTWIIRERLGTPLVPVLFVASGLFTVVSGLCAVGLAASAPGAEETDAILDYSRAGSVMVMADLRWLTGKIGFAAAGLALTVAARYQWRAGETLRSIAPVSAVLGLVMMLIWIDAATLLHRITGPAFLVWLIVIGGMLLTGRVERHFARMRDAGRP